MKRNIKFTSLVMSVIAIIILFAMLIGSTFAWFTDSSTSNNNIIKSGKLDVGMYWANGKEEVDDANWIDASTGAIFNYELWEPGYLQVRHIKIANLGTLAFKYKVMFIANGEVSDLADVIDVYYMDPAQKILGRTALDNIDKIGNLTTVLSGMDKTASGNLLAGEDHTITLALKMREDAGNEYQGKSIGTDFSIQLYATQLSSESDAFGDDYDKDLNPTKDLLFNAKELHKTTNTSGTFSLQSNIKTSLSGSDARYGYGYEYIIRGGVDYTLNLNGKSIVHDVVNANNNKNAFTYLLVANNAGTKLTIDGEGNVYCNNPEGYTCALQGKSGTLITVNGGDYVVDNGVAVWAGSDSHIIINDGSFVNGNATTDHELIYSSGGVIDIYGGFFHNTKGDAVLNVENRNRATSEINVYGGTFVNFDPSTGGDDPNQIKVAEGYKVIAQTQENGDIWYTVVPE